MVKQGKIQAFSPAVAAGVINDNEGRRFLFSIAEWLPANMQPSANMVVFFEEGAGRARKIKAAA